MKNLIILLLLPILAFGQNVLQEPAEVGTITIADGDSVGTLVFYLPIDLGYGRPYQQDGFDVYITEQADSFEVKTVSIEIRPVLAGSGFGSYIPLLDPTNEESSAVEMTAGKKEWFKVEGVPRTHRYELRITAADPYSADKEGIFKIVVGWH